MTEACSPWPFLNQVDALFPRNRTPCCRPLLSLAHLAGRCFCPHTRRSPRLAAHGAIRLAGRHGRAEPSLVRGLLATRPATPATHPHMPPSAALRTNTRTLACFRTPAAVAPALTCIAAMAASSCSHTCRWLRCFAAPSLHTSTHTHHNPSPCMIHPGSSSSVPPLDMAGPCFPSTSEGKSGEVALPPRFLCTHAHILLQ